MIRRLAFAAALLAPMPVFAFTGGNVVTYSDTTGAHVQDSGISVGTLPGGPKTQAFPSSFPGNTPIDALSVNVNSFPLSSMIPQGVLEGFTSAVVVPSSYTAAPWPNTAVSAYIINGNPTNSGSAVSVFSFAATNHDGAVAFGLNPVVSNCILLSPTNGCGVDGGGWIGEEIDVNVMKKGSATPIGEAKGLVITGGSEISPANSSFATDIFPLGTGIPWIHGLFFEDGATSGAAIEINQLTAGNNSASQILAFKSTDTVPTTRFTQIEQDIHGILKITGPQPVALAVNMGLAALLDANTVAAFHGPSADEIIAIRPHFSLGSGMLIASENDALNASEGLELQGSSIQLSGNTTVVGNLVLQSGALTMPASTTGAVTPAFTNAPTGCTNVIWIGPISVTTPSAPGDTYLAACHT